MSQPQPTHIAPARVSGGSRAPAREQAQAARLSQHCARQALHDAHRAAERSSLLQREQAATDAAIARSLRRQRIAWILCAIAIAAYLALWAGVVRW